VPEEQMDGALLALTFSLTEDIAIEPWLDCHEHLLVVDPATKEDFQHLSQLRERLISKDFEILAPCTHHGACPMANSKKDWCHFSSRHALPEEIHKIEQHLPWEHTAPAFSFLLASKSYQRKIPEGYGRFVGHPLREKGKHRQLFCQGSERLFVTALKKQVSEWPYRRGDCVYIKNYEKKGSELRVQSLDEITNLDK
jgi:hypothetical protein